MKTGKIATGRSRRPSVKLISEALNAAVRDAVEIHKQAGLPLAVWQDGKVALVPAESVAANGKGKRRPRRRKA
jgi:CubicO group peptidase (beta-lactamase class C family)